MLEPAPEPGLGTRSSCACVDGTSCAVPYAASAPPPGPRFATSVAWRGSRYARGGLASRRGEARPTRRPLPRCARVAGFGQGRARCGCPGPRADAVLVGLRALGVPLRGGRAPALRRLWRSRCRALSLSESRDSAKRRAERRPHRAGRLEPVHRNRPEGGAGPAPTDRAQRARDHVTSTVAACNSGDGDARAPLSSARLRSSSAPAPTELQAPPEHAAPSPVRSRPGPRGAREGAAGPDPPTRHATTIPTGSRRPERSNERSERAGRQEAARRPVSPSARASSPSPPPAAPAPASRGTRSRRGPWRGGGRPRRSRW